MDLINIKIVLLAFAVILAGKILLWIVGYIRMCRLLMKLPQKPSHWLYGHLQEIKSSVDYVKYVEDIMNTGAKLYCVWFGPFPAVGVMHPDTVKQLMKQEDRKSLGLLGGYQFFRGWLGDGLLLSSGKKWERNRRLLSPAFNFGILSGYVKTMNQTADGLIKASGKPNAKPDFLDILLTATDEQGQGLTEQEIQDEVDTFTSEGQDTTASAISWGIYSLAKYPELQSKVCDDVRATLGDRNNVTAEDIGRFKYLPMFIKETLRYWNPVPVTGRQHTSAPIILDGYEIPVGPRVDMISQAVHKNPQVWTDPEVFDPDRFSVERRDDTNVYGFIPFSAGTRNCIGQVFANNEIKIMIAKLLQRFEILADRNHIPEPLPDLVMRSSNGIRVILKKRK